MVVVRQGSAWVQVGIGLNKDTPPIDELVISVPRDRKYAFCTVQQTLVYGNMRKIYRDLQQYRHSANPV